jgi:glycosyltransferase involved in cell wall biosynthesis
MKVIIAIYQELIGQTVMNSAANVLNMLGRDLLKKNNLRVMYFSMTRRNDLKELKGFNISFLVLRYAMKYLHRITRIPTYKMRHYSEIVYDIVLAFRLLFIEGDLFITTNAWIPISCSILKVRGVKTILIAGNQNDNLYRKVIMEEKRQMKIASLDAFDYLPRNKKFNNCLKNIERIICFNLSIKDSYISDNLFRNKEYDVLESYFPANYSELNAIKNSNNSEMFNVGYLAHTTVLKGLHILLKAWDELYLPNSTLFIGGSIEEEYENYLRNEFPVNNVKYLGRLKEKRELYSNINLFVCPSIYDASPTTVVEAMYCNIPVLVSSGVGNKFLIKDGYNGYIYKNDSVRDLSQKISYIYNNKNQLLKMGLNASNTIAKTPQKNITIRQLSAVIGKNIPQFNS